MTKPFCFQPDEAKSKGDSLATDLDRMILAARQIGEVVGENLLADTHINLGLVSIDVDGWPGYGKARLYYQDALDLLTARVWRALQGWATAITILEDGIRIWWIGGSPVAHAPDLPAAVDAIYKHWKESRNGLD